MDKIKDWAKKNKGLATIVGLAIILFIILLIITLELLLGGSSNVFNKAFCAPAFILSASSMI